MKNQPNNQKSRQIRGKITKSSMTFNENKANLSEGKFGAKHFSTRIYERFHPFRGQKNKPNQTQFKPIQTQFKPNAKKAKNERKSIQNNEL